MPEPWQVKALNAAAAKRDGRHFREVPIVLQKYFCRLIAQH
jgi:hypothetical protein